MDIEPRSVVLQQVRYGYRRGREVLVGVDLAVAHGQIFALLGLNGEGKTTLLRLLVGLIRPTSGHLEVLGKAVGKGPPQPDWLARIGYVPERPFSGERSTARVLLDLMRAVHPRWDEATAQRYLDIFRVPLDTPCQELSAGTKSQLALLLAMAGNPDLLLLDEPTLGLDPWHRRQYLRLLLQEATDRALTIVLTSHDLLQIERMADRVAILKDGRIVVQEPLDELKAHVKRIRIGTSLEDAGLGERLRALSDVLDVEKDPGGFLLTTTRMSSDLATTLRRLPGVHDIQVVDLNLEDVFLAYCAVSPRPHDPPPR